MGAQLSRIGAGRGVLVVVACAILSLAGLTRSGIAGDDPSAASTHAPVVLAPPTVADPDLGSSGVPASSKTKPTSAGEKERMKTCVSALGDKLKVPRSFHCPEVQKYSGPAATDVTRGKGKTPVVQNGGTQPAGPLPQTKGPAPETKKNTQKKSEVKTKPLPTPKQPKDNGTSTSGTGGTTVPD